jgi:asparagine synthase (glutamine-hydrolysing)
MLVWVRTQTLKHRNYINFYLKFDISACFNFNIKLSTNYINIGLKEFIMCGIAGIKSTDTDQSVGSDLLNMLKIIKHRGPDGSGIYINGNIIIGPLNDLEVPEGTFGMGHNLLSIIGTDVSQPIEKHGLILVANAEIYNFIELKNCLDDYFKTDSDCEVIISVIKQFYNGSLLDAVRKSLVKFDGDYAFAIYDGNDCIVVRDPLGVKPVYYGEDPLKGISAFASERKALWKIGLKNVHTLAPDHLLLNGIPIKLENRENFVWKTNKPCSKSKSNIHMDLTLHDRGHIKNHVYNNYPTNDKIVLKKELKELLISAVEKRIKYLSHVGIVFSGGVDSSIIAKLSHDLGANITLYSVGHETSSDVQFAKQAALQMDLPLKIKTLDVEDVKKYTPLVLNAIEEFNIMKLGVGMPAYVASEIASSDGVKVMLSGQGADEIFAGYHRYIQYYNDKGENLQEDLMDDVGNLYHVNLQRDDAVTMANGIELRVPYLDLELVDMALKVPIKYKLHNGKDNLRKCILREIAADMGMPPEIVRRPKKAAQYGSGINKILVKKVLKDENYKNKLKALYKN